MTLHIIETGNFKLDGGAMFGVVPKTLWQRTNSADNNNMVDVAARCLLVEYKNRLTLIDTGLGNKQSDTFFGFYHLWGNYTLEKSLKSLGFHKDDITDVFMTHLHFDHCGGSVVHNSSRTGYLPAFKNARFWTNKEHWKWATQPNPREKASFLPENIFPLQESGQLHFISQTSSPNNLVTTELGFEVLFVDGHSEKQMIPHFTYQNVSLAYVADLIPTVGHIPLPYIPSFDTRPLISMEEKQIFLENMANCGGCLLFEHDAYNEVCTVKHTEKGVRLDKVYTFDELFKKQ